MWPVLVAVAMYVYFQNHLQVEQQLIVVYVRNIFETVLCLEKYYYLAECTRTKQIKNKIKISHYCLITKKLKQKNNYRNLHSVPTK